MAACLNSVKKFLMFGKRTRTEPAKNPVFAYNVFGTFLLYPNDPSAGPLYHCRIRDVHRVSVNQEDFNTATRLAFLQLSESVFAHPPLCAAFHGKFNLLLVTAQLVIWSSRHLCQIGPGHAQQNADIYLMLPRRPV